MKFQFPSFLFWVMGILLSYLYLSNWLPLWLNWILKIGAFCLRGYFSVFPLIAMNFIQLGVTVNFLRFLISSSKLVELKKRLILV